MFYKQQHRGRRDRAELLHDLRRHQLGLAGHAGELHVLRLRRGDPGDPAARSEVLPGQADRLLHPVGRPAHQDRPRSRSTPPDDAAIVDTARTNPDTGDPVPRAAARQLHVDRGRPHAHRARLQRPAPRHHLHLRRHRPGAAVHRHLVARGRTRATPAATTRTPSPSPTSPATRVTVPFTGTAIRWIGSKTNNHGIRRRLPRRRQGRPRSTAPGSAEPGRAVPGDRPDRRAAHPEDRGRPARHASGSTDNFVSIDAIDLPPAAATTEPIYPVVPQQPGTAITLERPRLQHHRGRLPSSATPSCSTPPRRSCHPARRSARGTSPCSTATRAPTARPCCATRRKPDRTRPPAAPSSRPGTRPPATCG